ncbi:12511_t:CDS:2 [Entrophospora sp. SA101]|nr:13792_t:CDS:2 [Entrophospora sp. SA101]CAJ0837576.1 12511_t:CDS:2 [Entrophospora sp. SA101]
MEPLSPPLSRNSSQKVFSPLSPFSSFDIPSPTDVPYSNITTTTTGNGVKSYRYKPYRMRICDASKNLKKAIKAKSGNQPVNTKGRNSSNNRASKLKRKSNPFPIRPPSNVPSWTLRINIYEEYQRNPKPMVATVYKETMDIFSSNKRKHGDNDSNNGNKLSNKKIKTNSTNKTKPYTSNRGKRGPQQNFNFEVIAKEIDQLEVDHSTLINLNHKVKWPSKPLDIEDMPHYNTLHQKEAEVASSLRMSPLQYLESKKILITSAREYRQQQIDFKKSNAQKLLRVDVNKAIKLGKKPESELDNFKNK